MIEVKNISKRFLFEKNNALENISFNVGNLDLCALVGDNGCGKTTIIRILCNLIKYDSGDIMIDKKRLDLDYVSYKKNWGIVLSKPYFIEEFNVIEYLKFVAKFQKIDLEVANSRIDDLISMLSLEDWSSKRIKSLSSGNQMKVSIASALIHNPDFLILDEPFVNLDISTSEKVISLLKSFKGKKSLIITSHNLDIITELCNKILVLEKGQVISELENAQFQSSDDLKKVLKNHFQNQKKTIELNWLK